jgi:hypothetical protein
VSSLAHLRDRIAILNHPSAPHATPWTIDAVAALAEMGFTAVQVNIGWGSRPGDEPLNLEDVVALDAGDAERYPQPLALRSDPGRFDARRKALTERIALCQAAGLRTALNFGAPYNQHAAFMGTPPNCLLDEAVIRRYELLLQALRRDFAIDYLWLYTYDQDAWLCSEFERCERCAGVPLHERLVPFLDRLSACWADACPEGRLWWEPWELSAGQTLKVIERVETRGFGLALHNNIGECMVALAGDRHVRNIARAAAARQIPVTLEGFFGAATEEVEPFVSLQSPLATFRQVRAMAAIDGVTGVKEYYGLDLSKDDPNLRAVVEYLKDPAIGEDDLLRRLSDGYGDAQTRSTVERIWRLTSEAIELYPWDASWFAREVGRSDPAHSLTGAFVRGMSSPDFAALTPSWGSTRGATYMLIDNAEPHPWLLEDVQLRWELCAERQGEALELAGAVIPMLSDEVRPEFERFVAELEQFRRRAKAYAYHCRETNLVTVLSSALERGEPAPPHVVAELLDVTEADRSNMATDDLQPAIDLLRADPLEFAATCFRAGSLSEAPRGYFSVTSR